jgi:hypothetical protein
MTVLSAVRSQDWSGFRHFCSEKNVMGQMHQKRGSLSAGFVKCDASTNLPPTIKTTLAGRELFVEAKEIPRFVLDRWGKQNIKLSMEKMLDKAIWRGAYFQALLSTP